MFHILSTLPPYQVTLLAGALVSVIHSGLVKAVLFRVKELSDSHKTAINWVTSFVFPVLATVALALHNSAQFNHAFPVYSEVFLSSQAFYRSFGKAAKIIRSWYEAYVILNAKTVAPGEASF